MLITYISLFLPEQLTRQPLTLRVILFIYCSFLFFPRYEDAFNRFADEINALAAYQWWEGSVYTILSILAFPFAWSWQQWRRRIKLQRLREFVRSEYDHACLRSCRSRALYEGLKVGLTSSKDLCDYIFWNF